MTLKNVGPVKGDFEIDLPPKGGLIVIEGENGAGKTTILRQLEVLQRPAGGRIPKTDGAREAVVEGFGKRLKMRKKVVHSGELTIDNELAGLDLDTLHSPPFKNAETRDKARIAALVSLAGVTPSIDAFAPLLDDADEFDRIVGPAARDAKDLVEMAGKVKRDFDAAARGYEQRGEVLANEARAKKEAFVDVDTDVPIDDDELNAALQEAIEHRARLVQQRGDTRGRQQAAQEARNKLAQSQAQYSGPTAADAIANVKDAQDHLYEKQQAVQRLRGELAEAERYEELAAKDLEAAKREMLSAQQHELATKGWRETIEASAGDDFDDQAIVEADREVSRCRKAIEDGQKARTAIEAKAEAMEKADAAAKELSVAETLRSAGANVADVLSQAVSQIPDCPLRVVVDGDGEPRLVVETSRGPETPFDELSDGERWKLIVPLLVRKGRAVILPQAAWGELQPANRDLIAGLCEQTGGWLVTAEATDGPLSWRWYRPAAA